MDDPKFIRRLHMNSREYDEVLARMQPKTPAPRNNEDRGRERHDYQITDIPLQVEHPEGGRSSFFVYGRNISRGGMSVLHAGFLHPGSSCQLVLSQLDGSTLGVNGEVRHCRLVAGSCHEVGIRFDEEIDPTSLVGHADDGGAEDADAAGAYLSIEGSILLAEPFDPDRELLAHHLSLLSLDVRTVETPGAMLDRLKRDPPSLTLSGLSLTGTDGVHTLASARQLGYDAPLIVLTPVTDSAVLQAAREAGATDIVPKPFNMDLLLAQLQAHLCDADPRESLYSTAADQPGMPPLIAQYVQVVRRIADQLERTVDDGERGALRALCCQLKGSGCGYGFQKLSAAAIQTLGALDAEAGLETALDSITALVDCCRSLQYHHASSGAK